jgi:hypothetical protein
MPSETFLLRRNRQRDALDGRVRLSWLDEKGSPREVAVRAIDFSETGVSVQSERPLPVRAILQFQIDARQMKGSACVRWCSRHKLGFRAGLEFIGQVWAPKR